MEGRKISLELTERYPMILHPPTSECNSYSGASLRQTQEGEAREAKTRFIGDLVNRRRFAFAFAEVVAGNFGPCLGRYLDSIFVYTILEFYPRVRHVGKRAETLKTNLQGGQEIGKCLLSAGA